MHNQLWKAIVKKISSSNSSYYEELHQLRNSFMKDQLGNSFMKNASINVILQISTYEKRYEMIIVSEAPNSNKLHEKHKYAYIDVISSIRRY